MSHTIVPKEYGYIGDLLLYKKDDSSYWWLKTGDPTTLNQYIVVGYLAYREGNECLILSTSDLTTSVWGNILPIFKKYRYIEKFNDKAQFASLNMQIAESFFKGNRNYHVLPITRIEWEEALYRGDTTITMEGKTVTLAEYNNNFDTWYRETVLVKYPAASGALTEYSGETESKMHYSALDSASIFKSVYDYSVSLVPEFGESKWWVPSVVEWYRILKNLNILKDRGVTFKSWYWSSVPSEDGVWCINATTGNVFLLPPSGYEVENNTILPDLKIVSKFTI